MVLLEVFFGDLRRRWGSALASVAVMTVGVGVFVAIYLAGTAARSSFVSTVEALAGRATHFLSREGGVSPARLTALLAIDGVEHVQPVVKGFITLLPPADEAPEERSLPPLRLLGLDPFFVAPFLVTNGVATNGPAGNGLTAGGEPLVQPSDFRRFLLEPGCVVLPRPWAEETGTRVGDRLTVAAAGREIAIEVLNVYDLETFGEATRDTAILDIAAAQELLGQLDHVDRFELIVHPGKEDAVAAALEPGERLERPRQRGERVARMTDAFRLNLLALGSLALLVGALLVFNAAQFRVVERQGLLGRLRSLGVTRQALLCAVLLEATVFGLIGGLGGVAVGVLLAQELVQPLAQTVRDLYAFVRVEVAPLTATFAVAVVAGSGLLTMIASFAPARDAAWTPPRLAGTRSREALRYRLRLRGFLVTSALATALGVGVLFWPSRDWWLGLVAAFAFLAAGAALLPPILAAILPPMKRAAESNSWVTVALATEALIRSLSRTGGAAAALAVALAMSLGVIVMVSSFESEVRRWIEATLRADLYVADPNESVTREKAHIAAAAVEEMSALPEVEALDTLRALEVPYGNRSIFFCGMETNSPRSWDRVEWLEGDRDQAPAQVAAGAALISEPLANRYDLGAGSVLKVDGRFGEESFPVVGVFRDYSMDRGYACTSRARFEKAFGDPGVRNVAIYLREGTDPEAIATRLRKQFAGRYPLSVRSSATLRGRVLEVFERTFQLTYLLQTISTAMALVGIAVTLLALFLERAREIAVLRALGATRKQVGAVFATEAFIVSVAAAVFALPLGAIIAWVLIAVVNLRAFGWTIPLEWPWSPILVTVFLAIAAGLAATLIPVLLARRQSLARALREE